MRNLEEIKKRFLKDSVPLRLGGIASNLARLESFSRMPNNKKAIKDLVEESKLFIEWMAPEASLDVQEELVDIQLQLALLGDSPRRNYLAGSADKWAEKILRLSGLSR